MDIDLRRLGMGAQLQIALALVGRGAERRDNHGRRGADCPVHRGAAAWPDLWATGGAANRGGSWTSTGEAPKGRKIKEDKQGRALEPALCGMTLCAASGPSGAAQRANALHYILN